MPLSIEFIVEYLLPRAKIEPAVGDGGHDFAAHDLSLIHILMERIAADPAFPMDHEHLTKLLSPENYTGRAAEQTVNFVKNEVDPALAGHAARDMGEIKL